MRARELRALAKRNRWHVLAYYCAARKEFVVDLRGRDGHALSRGCACTPRGAMRDLCGRVAAIREAL